MRVRIPPHSLEKLWVGCLGHKQALNLRSRVRFSVYSLMVNVQYRVKIILKGPPSRKIMVDFPNFALSTQLAEQVASQGYTQQVSPDLWEHYLPADIDDIFIERVPVAQQDRATAS